VRIAALALAAFAVVTAAGAKGPYRNGLVAFVRCCGSGTGIYVVKPDGSGARRIYLAAADDAPLTPAWSPNGAQIAFVPGAPAGGLWVMQANGSKQRRVTPGRGEPLFPSWSTDGTRIVFADRGGLYVVRTNGTGLKRLTTGADTNPVWAPNDSEIVFVRTRSLWRMNTDGTHRRRLLANATSPSWSPGATRIAFVRNGDPWIANANGTGAKPVVRTPENDAAVVWSPDGRWLLTAQIDRGDLVLVRPDGSATQPLTTEADFFHAVPSWQPLH